MDDPPAGGLRQGQVGWEGEVGLGPLKEERERLRAEQEEDEKELKKIHREQEKKAPVFDEAEVAPPTKKAKIEIGSMSLGALKTMIESDKEKIQAELDVELVHHYDARQGGANAKRHTHPHSLKPIQRHFCTGVMRD